MLLKSALNLISIFAAISAVASVENAMKMAPGGRYFMSAFTDGFCPSIREGCSGKSVATTQFSLCVDETCAQFNPIGYKVSCASGRASAFSSPKYLWTGHSEECVTEQTCTCL